MISSPFQESKKSNDGTWVVYRFHLRSVRRWQWKEKADVANDRHHLRQRGLDPREDWENTKQCKKNKIRTTNTEIQRPASPSTTLLQSLRRLKNKKLGKK